MNKRLEEIKARCEAATSGPWEMRKHCDESDHMQIHDTKGIVCETSLFGFEYPEQWCNGEFIANARQDIPYLLDYIKILEINMAPLKAIREICYTVLKILSEWQPMQAAPKDGTPILACFEETPTIHIISWLNDDVEGRKGWIYQEPTTRWVEDSFFTPKCWLMLPKRG